MAIATIGRDPMAAQFVEILNAGVKIKAQEVRDSIKLKSKSDELLTHKLRDAYNQRHE